MSEFCTPVYAMDGVHCLICKARSARDIEDVCLFLEMDEEVDDVEEGD
jgi:hypothetical protein